MLVALAAFAVACTSTSTDDGGSTTQPDDTPDTTTPNTGTTEGTTIDDIDESTVLDVLADGVDQDVSTADANDTTDETPFFGEDDSLYDAIDLGAAGDIDINTLLDAGRDGLGRGASQAVRPVADGFIGGQREDDGVLRGVWFDTDQNAVGAVRGDWTGLGSQLDLRVGRFNMKYIDDTGLFQGTLTGRWAADDNDSGFFLGQWFDADRQAVGVLRGHWMSDGGFVGRWAAFDVCSEADDLPDDESEDDTFAALARILATKEPEIPTSVDREQVEGFVDVKIHGEAPCTTGTTPHGFMRGTHTLTAESEPGTFNGRWVDDNGDLIGTLRGAFGTKSDVVRHDPGSNDPDNLVTTTISPDDFEDRTNLTLTVTDPRMTTADSDNGSFSLFDVTATEDGQDRAPSGSLVFGHSNIPFWNTNRRMRMDFALPVSIIEIAFSGGSSGGPEIGRLHAFNAQHVLVAEYTTEPRNTNDPEVMRVERPSGDIAWAVAFIDDDEGSFGRLDDLVFSRQATAATTTEIDADDPNAQLGVLFAEVINMQDEVIGTIRGHYDLSQRGVGVFRGRYMDAANNDLGTVKGRWHTAPGEMSGPFVGVWSGTDL
jgi:hypothetical protein